MGFVKSLLGGSPGGFQAAGPSSAQLKTSWEQQQASIKQQQDFLNAIAAQNGLGNQANVFQQQQGLANQFQNVANGQGPNPAMAALNQATGQNVANQAALMASQRGAGANTGLIARQAAMQGANTQQQAVGQAATMQAQQQLAAMGQLQQQQANMANLAGAQVGEQQTAATGLGQQTSSQRGQLLGQQAQANQINAGMAQQKAGMQGQLLGNLMGAAGTGLGMMFAGPAGAAAGNSIGSGLARGGQNTSADMFADGGKVQPRSAYGRMLNMATGGAVPAMVSPGEVYLNPSAVQDVKAGSKKPMDGEKIPGQPKVSGAKNSYANDTVPKTLEEGGIVIPRSVTQGKNPDKKAAEFVRAVLSKKGMK